MGKIKNSPGPVKKIMYLSAAYEYQHLYIAQQVGLCPNVPIMPIKTIAENSGMTVRKPTQSKTDRRSGSEIRDWSKSIGGGGWAGAERGWVMRF